MANPRVDELKRRIEREPGSRLFAQLAEELRKDGDLPEAIRVARAGLHAHPNYPSARLTLGRSLFEAGQLAAARTELEGVLRGAPDNILAARMLAECLEGLGDGGAALLQYRAAQRLSPGDRQIEAQARSLEQRLAGAASNVEPSGAGAPLRVLSPLPEPPVAPPAKPPGTSPSAGAHGRPPLQGAPAPTLGPGPVAQASTRPPRDAPPAPPPMDPGADFEDVFEPGPSWKGTGAVASAAAGEAIVLLEDEAPTLPGAPFPRPQVSAPLPPGGVESPLRGPVDNPAASPWSVADVAAEADIEPPLHATSTAAPAAIPVPGQGTIEEPPPLPVFAPASLGPSSPEPGLPEPGPALSTPTMAELYFDQGFFARAIAVYEEILEREPSNERARARLIEIGARARTLDGPPAPDPRGQRRQAIERTISRLEQMLAAVRRG